MKHIKKLLIRYFSRLLFLVQIQGESGWPVLVPGKLYFATNLLRARTGDLIIFRNPKNADEVFVKGVAELHGSRYAVESLVSWGSSSKEFGLIGKTSVLGKIVLWNRK